MATLLKPAERTRLVLHQELADPVADAKGIHYSFRALRIGDPDDLALLQTISRGEFATAGFRNRQLRRLLHPASSTAPTAARRRLSAQVSRKLRLLRAHGLIKKIPRTHRYQLTERGRLLTAALRATRDARRQRQTTPSRFAMPPEILRATR